MTISSLYIHNIFIEIVIRSQVRDVDNTEKGYKYFTGLIRWKNNLNNFFRLKEGKTTKEICNLPFEKCKMYFELPYFLKDKGSFYHVFRYLFLKTVFKLKNKKYK